MKKFFVLLVVLVLGFTNLYSQTTNKQTILDFNVEVRNFTLDFEKWDFKDKGIAEFAYFMAFTGGDNPNYQPMYVTELNSNYGAYLNHSSIIKPVGYQDNETLKIIPLDVKSEEKETGLNTFAVCGKFEWGKIRGAFITRINKGTGEPNNVFNFQIYPEIEKLTSITIGENNSLYACGNMRMTADGIEDGIIMNVNYTDSSPGVVNWVKRIGYGEPGTEVELNQIIGIDNRERFAVIGTSTNRETRAKDVLIAIYDSQGNSSWRNIYTENYNPDRTFDESGITILEYKDFLVAVGTTVSTVHGTAQPVYSDILMFTVDKGKGTVLVQNRYNFQETKKNYEYPQKIMFSEKTKNFWITGWASGYDDPGAEDGFLIEVTPALVFQEVTLFGDNKSDFLYDIHEPNFDASGVDNYRINAAGYTKSYNDQGQGNLWIVEKIDNPQAECYDKIIPFEQIKVDLQPKDIKEFDMKIDPQDIRHEHKWLNPKDVQICDGGDDNPCPNEDPDCVTEEIVISTGYNPFTNMPTPVGNQDAVWELISAPGSPLSLPMNAYVVQPASAWGSVYNAQWLGAYPTNQSVVSTVYQNAAGEFIKTGDPYVFARPFCVCEGDMAHIDIEMFADNYAEVFINGNMIGSTNWPIVWNHKKLTTISADAPLHPDHCDTLYVHLYNNGVGTPHGFTLSAKLTDAYFLRDECCECIDKTSSIGGYKYQDVNGNGTHDSWEPLLSGWTINLTNSGSTVNLTAVTDANGYYNFGGLVPDTYTISETNQSGWVQTQPATSSNWTITIAGDYEHHSANFGNRKDPPSTDCHIKIGSIDEDCCCYTFTMINPFGKSISKIELVTDDGILQSWNPNFSCDAGTHSPIPAPNVGWDFTTACDDDISWTVCFRSTTNHGVIITNWVIYFDDDTMCEHTETIKCEPATQLACDRISVKTIVNGKLPITNRRYRITNTKIPASDICQVVINYTPANYQGTSIPVPDVAGVVRVLSSPSASIQHLGMAINPPYTNLDLSSIISNPTDMPHTGGYVEFNIGLNYQRNWDGVVEILVIHCDGDTCTFTNKWKLKKPFISHDVVSVIRRAMSDSLFAVPLRIQAKTSSGNVGSISFYLDPDDDGDTVPTIFAISGAGHILDDADADNRTILRSAQGQSQARFEFNPPLVINKDMAALELNLVLSHDGNIPDEIPIRWTMHGVDDDCDGIDDDCDGIDGGMITVTTTSVIEQIVNEDSEQISIVEAYPNPASTKTTIKYDLRTADNVHVSLYDEQGKFIRDIDNSFKAAERNSVEVNTTALVSGTYFVKFETSNGRIVSVKFVVKK